MVQVRQSTVIDAPVEDVWRVLRDFNGHDRWHPAIATSAIEGGRPVDMVGAVRRFRLADGGELREQLLSLSDDKRTLTYCLLEAPLPLMGYVATIRLKPVTDGERTFWEWRSEFRPPEHRREELTALVRDGVYRAGFEAIRRMFGGRPIEARREPPMPPPPTPAPMRADAALPSTSPAQPATATTRAIVVERYGGPEVLEFKEMALPAPAPGEVLIRHTAIGVNFIDVYCRTGYFDLLTPPGVPGMEAAGIVEAVGPGRPPVAAATASPMPVRRSAPMPSGASCRRNCWSGCPTTFPTRRPRPACSRASARASCCTTCIRCAPARWCWSMRRPAASGSSWCNGRGDLGATVIATVSGDDKARIAERLRRRPRHHLHAGRISPTR